MSSEADTPELSPADEKCLVVCVDDQPEVLAALRRALREEPYELRTTDSPELALQWTSEGGVNVLIVDERMPAMSGTHLLDRVRKRSPGTFRVVLTAYPGSATIRHALAQSIDCLIGKPWNDDALRLTLRGILDQARAGPGQGPLDERRRAPPSQDERKDV